MGHCDLFILLSFWIKLKSISKKKQFKEETVSCIILFYTFNYYICVVYNLNLHEGKCFTSYHSSECLMAPVPN